VPAPIEVRKVPLHNVSDASELAKLIDDGVMEADRVIAVIGKTEGNGGVNDYTRIIADRAFREVLEEKGSRTKEQVKQIPIVWSGGTDGVISPHATIFATLPADAVEPTDEPRSRRCMTSASAGISISPRATAIPSAAQPLDRSMESPVFSVHTVCPRLFASRMVWIVSSGVFVCT